MLAYSYPLLGAFWTLLWLSLWIIWIFILFRVIIDIFRSQDLSGWGKAGWLIFVIILPFLGVFIYLIARGKEMGQRDVQDAQARDQEFPLVCARSGGRTKPERGRPAGQAGRPQGQGRYLPIRVRPGEDQDPQLTGPAGLPLQGRWGFMLLVSVPGSREPKLEQAWPEI